jgi:hypothetical protein
VKVARRMVGLTLLTAALVVGCQSSGKSFRTTLRPESEKPVQVTLTDETTLVTQVTPAPADAATIPNDPAVHLDEADPNRLVLTWLGGVCDHDAAVWFGSQNGAYVMSVAIHEEIGLGGCPGAGVPRAIGITTSRPIPVGSIVVAGGS